MFSFLFCHLSAECILSELTFMLLRVVVFSSRCILMPWHWLKDIHEHVYIVCK